MVDMVPEWGVVVGMNKVSGGKLCEWVARVVSYGVGLHCRWWWCDWWWEWAV